MGIQNPGQSATNLDPQSQLMYYDDFAGGGGIFDNTLYAFFYSTMYYYNVNCQGPAIGSISAQQGTLAHPGLMIIATRAFATDWNQVQGFTPLSLPPNFIFKCSFRNNTAAEAVRKQRVGLGNFLSGAVGEPVEGCYLRNNGLGNWFAVCRTGGLETAIDTGIAPDTNFHSLIIRVNNNVTQVVFYVDGVLKASISANIPVGSIGIGYSVDYFGGAGTAQQFQYDYLYCLLPGLTR